MKKNTTRIIVLALCLTMVLGITACGGGDAPDVAPAPAPEPAPAEPAPADPAPADPAPADPAEPPVNPNIPDYTYIQPEGEIFDFNTYYNEKDASLEANVSVRQTGGTVGVPDKMTTPMPKALSNYTIGFSVYYTVDEVGAMILDTMIDAAAEAGVELLVNDANYDQNAQNTAIEQWILQGVDGVILAPCDFYGVKDALDKLADANIPVVTLNAPLAGEADAIVFSECVEQGQIAGQMLIDHLNKEGVELSGKVIFQTLPFVHPNAVTREIGFREAFAAYPDVEIVMLTGISPEDHYVAFEGALLAYPDMIGAWGLYSSATIGMMNAKLAANSPVPLTSIDNDKIILAGIKEGNIIGSACYSSIAPAWWTMTLMVNMLNGVTIPGTIMYENIGVTPANVEAMFEHYYPGQTLAGYMAGE